MRYTLLFLTVVLPVSLAAPIASTHQPHTLARLSRRALSTRQDRYTQPDGGFAVPPVAPGPGEPAPGRFSTPDGGFAKRQDYTVPSIPEPNVMPAPPPSPPELPGLPAPSAIPDPQPAPELPELPAPSAIPAPPPPPPFLEVTAPEVPGIPPVGTAPTGEASPPLGGGWSIYSRQDRYTQPDGGFYVPPVGPAPGEPAPGRYDAPDGGWVKRQGAEPDVWTPSVPEADPLSPPAPGNGVPNGGSGAVPEPTGVYVLPSVPAPTEVYVPPPVPAPTEDATPASNVGWSIATRQDRYTQPDGGFYVAPAPVAPAPVDSVPGRYEGVDGGWKA